MDRPLEVIDMQNVTLKSTNIENVQPLLVTQFRRKERDQCHEIRRSEVGNQIINYFSRDVSLCYSALHLINVTLAHIDGLQITVKLPYLGSGLIIEQSIDIYINNTALLTNGSRRTYFLIYEQLGLLVFNSSRIVVESLQANNFVSGIALWKSHSISVSDTWIQNCTKAGVLIIDSGSVSVMNVQARNSKHGLISASSSHIIITNSTLLNNTNSGITLRTVANIDIQHSFIDNNGINGLYFTDCTNTLVKGTHITRNKYFGLFVHFCTDLTMINILVKHNAHPAIYIEFSKAIMKNVYISNSSGTGMRISNADMHMENVLTEYNQVHGIELTNYHCNHVTGVIKLQ